MDNNSCTDCRAHSGVVKEIKNMKENIAALWDKWGYGQKLLIAILLTVVGNLFGLVVLIWLKANGG